ncbi:hypothetical protein FSP39_008410 [Pinctada imbricata]|uniref:VWFA domain-containing protein n=1 Tax=Pinctada imbricata TaxID=66713 RepID=A0AA88XF25_PINIB|nr:hypothetical protein FSP39_008410 [Pinctada imbricata]
MAFYLFPACALQKFDILFILDGSVSVGQKIFNLQKEVVKNITENLSISDTGVRVGVEVFNNKTTLNVPLNKFSDQTGLMKAISNISYQPTGIYSPNIGQAIDILLEIALSPSNGNRPDVHDIVVFLTNGQAPDQSYTQIETSLIHSKPISVFTLLISQYADEFESDFFSLPTDTDHLVIAETVDMLPKATKILQQKICKVKSDLGSWSSWGTWSSCVSGCHVSNRYRTRKCFKDNTYLHPCIGNHAERKQCILHQACASVPFSMKYVGCYVDSETRIFPSSQTKDDEMTWRYCANFCLRQDRNYQYMGLQYLTSCFCGYGQELSGAIKATESDCNRTCPADPFHPTHPCGGTWRMSVVRLLH